MPRGGGDVHVYEYVSCVCVFYVYVCVHVCV